MDALAWIGISADDPALGPYFQSHNRDAHIEAATSCSPGVAHYCDLTPEQIDQRAKSR